MVLFLVVFEEIAKKLQEQGYTRDWDQCRNKILKKLQEYRSVKDNNGPGDRKRRENL